MRHQHHVGLKVRQLALRDRLDVPREQHGGPTGFQPEHDRTIVLGLKSPLRPQHLEPPCADVHPGGRLDDKHLAAVRPHFGHDLWQQLTEVGLIRNPQLAYRHVPGETHHASDMVGIAVRGHQEIDTTNAAPLQRIDDALGLSPRIDENHRSEVIRHQNRITLTHIEERHRGSAGGSHRSKMDSPDDRRRAQDQHRTQRTPGGEHADNHRDPDASSAELGPPGGLAGDHQNPGRGHHTRIHQYAGATHHADASGDGGDHHEGCGRQVGRWRQKRHAPEVENENRDHSNLGGNRRPQPGPQGRRSATGEHLRTCHHPGGRRGRELEANVCGELTRDADEDDGGDAERRPGIDGDGHDPRSQHDGRHGCRSQDGGFPPGDDHEQCEADHADDSPETRMHRERRRDHPPGEQEQGHVASGDGDVVRQPRAPQRLQIVTFEPGRVTDEKPGEQRAGGPVRVRSQLG